jgi:elongation factor G
MKAGDLGAVAKLKDTRPTTPSRQGGRHHVRARSPSRAGAVVRDRAEEPRRRRQDQHGDAPPRGRGSDDPLQPRSADHELLLAGQGQLHIEVTVAKLKRRFGVEVNLKPPRIPYRETITRAPKRTAGTRSRPAATASSATARSRWSRCRAAATSSSSTTSSAARSRAVRARGREGHPGSRLRGYLAGYPVVDFRVTVYDGSYHDVDSNELSFKTAGLARVQGRHDAAPADAPRADHERRGLRAGDYAGDLMGDLNGRRGRIAGMDTRGATT